MSHRPRNRQPRPNTNNINSPRPNFQNQSNPNVPRFNQIAVDTPVSVILKQDQPTGRQVQGLVAELLTRGDHPRGVKVRLTDGRVGRVQRLVSEEEGRAGTSMQPMGRNGEAVGGATGSAAVGGLGRIKYQDVREDGYDYESREKDGEGPSLEDYLVVKPAKRKKGKKAPAATESSEADAGSATQDTPSTATSTCPVCNAFEGDEDAVSRHVGTHFE